MSLTLADLDDFTLDELGHFTLQEIDDMSSYKELYAAVQEQYRRLSEVPNDKELPLTNAQIQAVVEIARACGGGQPASMMENITTGVAIQMIGSFLLWCTKQTIEHLPEIISTLEQARSVLEEFLKQVT